MDISFVVPGTTGPQISVERNVLGGLTVMADGRKIPKHGNWRPSYPIALPDGTTVSLSLTGSMVGLKARVNGAEFPIEPPLKKWEQALVLLPIALVAVGGALGAIIGLIAAAANARVMRSSMSMGARSGTALLNLVLAGGAWYLALSIVRTLIS